MCLVGTALSILSSISGRPGFDIHHERRLSWSDMYRMDRILDLWFGRWCSLDGTVQTKYARIRTRSWTLSILLTVHYEYLSMRQNFDNSGVEVAKPPTINEEKREIGACSFKYVRAGGLDNLSWNIDMRQSKRHYMSLSIRELFISYVHEGEQKGSLDLISGLKSEHPPIYQRHQKISCLGIRHIA